ncbi:MAG: hypothetical protein U9R14_04290 [Patescibacteria group bacterium]|nr:hypothetical protein [Patescibacteria group bacterium]
MIITQAEKDWVNKEFLDLKFLIRNNRVILAGKFKFNAGYSPSKNIYFYKIEGSEPIDTIVIKDFYKIEIILFEDRYPTVKEVGGRIKKFAQKTGKNLPSLHVYDNNEVCSVGVLDENKIFSIPEFLAGPVLQFFYDHSSVERKLNRPRGEYSHGGYGVVENYYIRYQQGFDDTLLCIEKLKGGAEWDIFKKILKRKTPPKGHWLCFCEKGKEGIILRRCHSEYFQGIWILYKQIKDKQIDL